MENQFSYYFNDSNNFTYQGMLPLAYLQGMSTPFAELGKLEHVYLEQIAEALLIQPMANYVEVHSLYAPKSAFKIKTKLQIENTNTKKSIQKKKIRINSELKSTDKNKEWNWFIRLTEAG
eukprot:Pgem_evm1s13209